MTMPSHYQTDILQDRFALRLTARLSDGCDDLSPDISERLRFARSQALAKRKIASDSLVAVAMGGGAATLGGMEERVNWWNRLSIALPVLALVAGLITINAIQDERTAQELAQVDAALLTDDLPLAAYADPGFAQFLKISRAQSQ